MEPGFMLDVTRGAYLQAAWVEGRPEASMWTGLKVKGRRRIPVRTFQCEACGYLESYAPMVGNAGVSLGE
jgi:hypothetical protein